MPMMPSSSRIPPMFSQLFVSFLVSLLSLVLFSSSPISATSYNINTSNVIPEAISSTQHHQKCIHQHFFALVQLKRVFDLNLNLTDLLSSWNASNTDCCSWEGITCDTFTGHVIGLELDLTLLVPSYLSYSASLKLESTGMGEIFRNLSTLRVLNIDWVNMSAVGSHWSRIFPYALPNLRKLSMRKCGLSGPIHPSFSRLHFLTHLDLSFNDFSSPVPQVIANFTSLVSLGVSGCGLHGEFPMSIFSLPKLQTIDISGNQFLTIYLPKLSTNFTIQQLMMSETQFHGNFVALLGNFKSLTDLDLRDCNISGPISQSHLNFSQLVNLDLSNNNIQGPIPRPIFELTQLNYLDLSSNNFSGVIDLGSFQNLKKLLVLDLSHNSFSSIIDARNRSTLAPFPYSSVDNSRLVNLDLSNNNIQGPIPRLIFELTQLNHLDLSSNNFSGVIDLGSFQNLEHLQELNLSGNSFSSIINDRNRSKSSVNINQLIGLYLANNQFHCDIPSSIGELKSLHLLNMSNNHFQGIIPPSLGNIRDLESLDLSQNSLRGDIPWQLTELPFLAVLNLSRNQLTGSIPLGGQFITFKNDSFVGNPGLCGPPLSRKCEKDAGDAVSPPPTQSDNRSELDLM